MKIYPTSFNIYLLLVSLFLSQSGMVAKEEAATKTDKTARKEPVERKPKKEFATIRFHLETNLDGTAKTKVVPIYRASPFNVTVEEAILLDEGSVEKAALVDLRGNYGIELTLNHHGTFFLDTITTANKGKRLAIYSEFGQSKDLIQNRWLGAPVIDKRNASGVITFTPDASRDEAERIVNGLNNIAKIIKRRSS
jgi:preprotein translocase subunit SecD